MHSTPGTTARRLLTDRRGGFRDVLIALVVVSIASATAAIAAPTSVNILTSTTSSAERLSAATALVDDRRSSTPWGTADAPRSVDLTLPSGTHATALTWAEAAPGGTTYRALIPRSVRVPADACTTSASASNPQCVLVTSFRADDITTLIPTAVVRMDPSMTTPTGSVNAGVGKDARPLLTGDTIATAQPAANRAWRYLVHAASQRTNGELRIVQAGNRLATIPLTSTPTDYFGTVSVQAGSPVTFIVTDGPATIDTVLAYDAGATE